LRVVAEYDHRNAKAIIRALNLPIQKEIYSILNNPNNRLILGTAGRKQQDLSQQIKTFFIQKGWQKEANVFSLDGLHYDLLKGNIPLEIEIGHKRLVYATFFKFLADYSHGEIPAGIMVVTKTPADFGHTWHNSIDDTQSKIQAIKSSLLVPILVLGIKP